MASAPHVADGTDMTTRILEATGVLLAGPRKLSYIALAAAASISRPTLYKYFPSKRELLLAYAKHERRRFVGGMATALEGLVGAARLERALRYIVEFQRDHPMRGLVATEPIFVLGQLERDLRTMRDPLVPLFEELLAQDRAAAIDLAELVVRTATSYFLVPGDDTRLLRVLRRVANLPDGSPESRSVTRRIAKASRVRSRRQTRAISTGSTCRSRSPRHRRTDHFHE
jgi:AcrR family transcriptional regulator